MKRRSVHCIGLAVLGIGIAATTPAMRQHHHHSGGHWHSQPGHFHRHGNHYDYHPGRSYYHPTPTYTPSYAYPERRYHYPDYHDGHSHDHQHTAARPIVEYTFGGFSHIDDLAVQLEREANALCLELHYNYQHNPGFGQTYRESYES